MSVIPSVFKSSATILAALVLAGCSQKFQTVQDTFSLALFGPEALEIDPSYVENLPYASMYVKNENGGTALMVLGYADPLVITNNTAVTATVAETAMASSKGYRLKWLSANQEMLITEFGRIVKTVNFGDGNITDSYSMHADPIALGLLKPTTPKTWTRTLDWQPGNHIGYTLTSTFEFIGEALIVVNDKPVPALSYIEQVNAPELDMTFTNTFWLEPVTGRVIASEQIPAPGFPRYELTELKRFSGVDN
ncbi:YjbF family lipoprotein [Enterovibrio sp. ZSDZ35]|uniref:YjbF family lipoprotein n=1 Tax=Enterovibrio qingdaonensis TaxID=2899818 RepID=A0ABT5QP54_9GAMM|nr:YjbF family lipoprotein [Enterovibrio sp. ZSDZ35]MDD1782463.1 YjbF family lipoprotein [Enterovibrio sp. ZSDZ35]